MNNEFVYTHSFSSPGRTFSIGLNTSFGMRNSDYGIFSINNSFDNDLIITDSSKQSSSFSNKNFNSTFNLILTDRLSENSFLRLRFNPFFFNEERVRDTYKSDTLLINEIIYDSLYSNTFKNQNFALRGSASYRYNSENTNIEIDFIYQHQVRRGIQTFPYQYESRKIFNAILPSMEINYRPDEFKRLRIDYNTRAQVPTITQLQNTIDFSNPNFLRTGNPDLDKVFVHFLRVRYFITNPEKGTFNAYNFNFMYSIDNISNNVLVFTKDTLIAGNIFISKGTQLSYPINIGNAFSISLNAVNSFKVALLRSNLSFCTTLNISRTPNLINGKENTTLQYRFEENFLLSSSLTEFDYRISYSPNFTYSFNSLNKNISRILIHNASMVIKLNFWNNFYLGTKILTYYNSSASNQNDKTSIICNLALSYSFLANNSGELKFEVIDLLNQRKKLNRMIYEDYYEDRTTEQLERFFILSFTYNLRQFSK